MNSPGHRSRTAEDAVRILQLVRSLDQLHVQRASVMASLTDTLVCTIFLYIVVLSIYVIVGIELYFTFGRLGF